MIRALVALGNIGTEYERTYHNVGVFVAQQIKKSAQAEGVELAMYEPTGFMNVSGAPVVAWLKMNNLSIGDCLVVHDESDLVTGAYKLVRGGGSAGHNGINSLIDHLHTEDFWRLRVGIRDPREQVRKKAADFVLSSWSGSDEEAFKVIAHQAWSELKSLKNF